MKQKKKSFGTLMLKGALLAGAVALVVAYTDYCNLFEADRANNHTQRKWESFYAFTHANPVDVVLVGNSRLYTGVDPTNMSVALGANCFVLASPGTTVADSYWCLKEAISRTKPKIAIIETFTIGKEENRKLSGGKLSDQFKSYSARKNMPLKLLSLPALFAPDHWAEALSTTVRNHSFIFRDTKQLAFNRAHGRENPWKGQGLYLGRYVRFTSGIEAPVLERYAKDGAPLHEEKFAVGSEHRRYVRRIVRLCERNGVVPVFATLPVYKDHVSGHGNRRAALDSLFESLGARHLDLQQPWTGVYDTDCFENTYRPNQHMTYSGSLRTAYQLAHYIKENLPGTLPDRSSSQKWLRTFYGQDGWFENRFAADADPNVRKLDAPESLPGAECLFVNRGRYSELIVRVPQQSDAPAALNLSCTVEPAQGTGVPTQIDLQPELSKDYLPEGYNLYTLAMGPQYRITEVQ